MISLLILYSSYPVLTSSFLNLIHILNKEKSIEYLQIKKKISDTCNLISLNYYQLNSEYSIVELEGVVNCSEIDQKLKKNYRNKVKSKIEEILKDSGIEEYFIDLKIDN